MWTGSWINSHWQDDLDQCGGQTKHTAGIDKDEFVKPLAWCNINGGLSSTLNIGQLTDCPCHCCKYAMVEFRHVDHVSAHSQDLRLTYTTFPVLRENILLSAMLHW